MPNDLGNYRKRSQKQKEYIKTAESRVYGHCGADKPKSRPLLRRVPDFSLLSLIYSASSSKRR